MQFNKSRAQRRIAIHSLGLILSHRNKLKGSLRNRAIERSQRLLRFRGECCGPVYLKAPSPSRRWTTTRRLDSCTEGLPQMMPMAENFMSNKLSFETEVVIHLLVFRGVANAPYTD